MLRPPETILKNIYAIPAVWLMLRLIKARLPGAMYIGIGSGALIWSSIFVGALHLLGDTWAGKRVFLQVGVLVEILFFSAALGRKDYLSVLLWQED